MRAYRSKRSMTMVTRTDAQGSSTEGYLWMGPEGVLSASVAVDASEVTLRLEPGASRFRALIDMVGLGPRPAPMRGFEPAQIRQDLLVALVDHDAEPGTPGRARAELSDAVHEIAPGVAQCLGNGEATVVGFASEWVGTDGEATAATTFIDTPEGYLLHSSERRLLRQKHFVEPAPTWLVWASVVRRVPSRVDVESWLESARS